MMLIDVIESAWGWTGIKPDRIVGENDFGNLMVKDHGGRYWRLCPEDLYCEVVAATRSELDELSARKDFQEDWGMAALVAEAREQLGPLRPGYKYCLKIPSVLGGEYGGANLATIAIAELVSASGSIAQQIAGLPDGAQVRLSIIG